MMYNVLSSDGLFTTQHGRYFTEAEANAHAARLKAEGVNAYVTVWRPLA